MINKNYDRVSKAYRKASPAKKRNIIITSRIQLNLKVNQAWVQY